MQWREGYSAEVGSICRLPGENRINKRERREERGEEIDERREGKE